METQTPVVVTIETTVNVPVEKAWETWNEPSHITKWNHAIDTWHSPKAEIDLREGGTFKVRMEARDGSMGFDYGGVYNVVKKNEYIEQTLGDGRKVRTSFHPKGNSTHIVESFDAESQNPVEMQRGGWQAILDNYKKYTESL